MKLTDEHIGEPLPKKWCDLIREYTTEDDQDEARKMITPTMSIYTLRSILRRERVLTIENRIVINALVQVARSRKAITVK